MHPTKTEIRASLGLRPQGAHPTSRHFRIWQLARRGVVYLSALRGVTLSTEPGECGNIRLCTDGLVGQPLDAPANHRCSRLVPVRSISSVLRRLDRGPLVAQ